MEVRCERVHLTLFVLLIEDSSKTHGVSVMHTHGVLVHGRGVVSWDSRKNMRMRFCFIAFLLGRTNCIHSSWQVGVHLLVGVEQVVV